MPYFTDTTDKKITEIEMCDTLPDLPGIDETEFGIQLCDTLKYYFSQYQTAQGETFLHISA